ncbi:MAG TPA: protease pro-enzyme activation domain-containing protein [Bryobacteraceae bacterium]|nr:protease pro-enzyme activation domain-containing protein [Bryobacteraceae bacterium]
MEQMILSLKPDPAQEAALEQLIATQNNPKSPQYHHFLKPAEYGARFGIAQSDLTKVIAWLRSYGFTIDEVPASHRAIVFSGSSGQVESAFKTQIRGYNVGGQLHFANAHDPEIPAALAGVVGGVVKLHDFRHRSSVSKTIPVTEAQLANPQFTSGSSHYLSPADYSTIYDINPLYSAGVNGTGQSIAIIARSNIRLSDVESFRSYFGLPANDPTVVLVNSNPGVLQGDSTETILDTEWSGAVAPKAAIKVVVAASTNTADGIDLSAQYAVNKNVAPVISVSYGSCEAYMGTAELAFYNSLWQQAAAQGISVMVSSGDSGAAGCSGGSASSGSGAAINGLCSSPYSTCVGGTEFVEGSNPGQYWLPGNNAVYGSATGYIPEAVWNESGFNGGSGLWAGGGGASIAYTKPLWQTGPGVPADGKRDVPDVSLAAAGHDGYVIVESGGMEAIAGTSASAPSFAGLMALVNQKTGAAQGLANAIFYPLAANQAAGGAAIFHDTVAGNNSVPGVSGFAATAGYDRASGLGSVDATLLVNHWADATKTPTASLTLSASSTALTVKIGQSVQATITSTATNLKTSIALSVTGAPAGITVQLGAASIASPGSGSVVLTVTVAGTMKPGSYPLTVTGQGGGQTANLAISVTVPTPTFTIATNITSASIVEGSSAQVVIAVTPQNGFNSSLALSVTGLPTGVTAAFSPASISGAAAASSTLTLNVAKTAAAGSYSLKVNAVGGGITQSVALTLQVTVPATCTFAVNPGSVTLAAGKSAALQVSCGSVQGTFSGPLALSVAGLPTGVTEDGKSLTAGSTATATLSAASTAKAGSYSLSFTAAGSGFTKTLTVPLTITVPATFSLTSTQSSLTIKAGASAQLTATTVHSGTFNSIVSLTASGSPSGVTASFSKSSFAAPGDGTATVTFAVAASAKSGTYSVVLTGTGGGLTASAPVTLIIPAAATTPNFTFSLNTNALTIQAGGAAGTVVVSTGNFTGAFNSTITITFSGLVPGMNYGATGATAANNLVNTSIGITAAASTTPGTYPITIKATGAGISYSSVVQVTITKAAVSSKH